MKPPSTAVLALCLAAAPGFAQGPPVDPADYQHLREPRTAEILHIGPYDREQPTVARLQAFVATRGYETYGGHEEDIRGPSMAGPGNPEEYVTVLRYRVRRVR